MTDKPAYMNAITTDSGVRLSLAQDCKIGIGLEVGEADTVPILTIGMPEATAKEVFLALHGIYGMSDYEACARFTQEQYEFLKNLANSKEMTIEDVLRDLVQREISGGK